MNKHKEAILAAIDGGASTEVTKAAMAAVDAVTRPIVIEIDREEDGRWIADVPALGCMSYGDNREDAIARVVALLPCVEIREVS